MRITPDEVLNAYRETRVTPTQGEYYAKEGEHCYACALGVLALYHCPRSFQSDWAEPWQYSVALGLSEDYVTGFTEGFDGLPWEDAGGNRAGYEDGKLVASVVFGKDESSWSS